MNCNNNCGVDIHFDPNVKSKSGKCIPLEFDNSPHKCINSPFNKKKEEKHYGASYDELNGFYRYGNIILHRSDFCKCRLYTGLLTTHDGQMVVAKH